MHNFLTDRKTLKGCHIYQMLKKSAKKRHLSFHTPGHKKGKWDLTELSYSDNLSSPSGCILKAQEDIATLLGADESFILTDGSTSGILSMVYAAKLLGVKRLALSAFSHKSVFNACKAVGIETEIVSAESKDGYFTPITAEELLPALEKADGAIITSPTYFGGIADLAKIKAVCKEKGKLLLVDGAHGGHLRFEKEKYAGTYADMWVDGVHKSLPAFTQGAVVSGKGEKVCAALKDAVDVFRTSSPSYPIMASVEYAVKYPRNTCLEKAVLDFIEQYAKSISFGGDWTKLCVCVDDGNALVKDLEKSGLYAEFCTPTLICFYLSPATKIKDFNRLKRALIARADRFEEFTENAQEKEKPLPAPVKVEKNSIEYVDLSQAEGRICARQCGLFPPCVPIVVEGEEITEEVVRLLKRADSTFGLQEKKIAVFKEETV